jgi:hypothetical protein
MRETPVQQRARLVCAQYGVLDQRNNVGAMQGADGRVVRFGLLNESPKQNAEIKSSDLICIQPVKITPDMVGQTLGVFVALETKSSDWHLTPGDKHGQAQANYHRLVIRHGGRAGFVTCDADVRRILMVE